MGLWKIQGLALKYVQSEKNSFSMLFNRMMLEL